MATPSEKLAQSLEILHELQKQEQVAIRSRDLTRTHRERLVKNGFLQEVMKGWYIPSRPNETTGESTAWHASFWAFCATYLDQRFGSMWCLSPEQSISLHAENRTTPNQILVRSPKASNNMTTLLHGTSLLDIDSNLPQKKDITLLNRLRLFSLPSALVACSPDFFTKNPTDVRAALLMVQDASEILPLLLENGKSTVAGRLAGAFRNIGRDRIADEIIKTMRAANFDVRESDPFGDVPPVILSRHSISPYVNRVRLMWQHMRQRIIDVFPPTPGLPSDIHAYMEQVEGMYLADAYHSLSIEGYRVSPELIEIVRSGNWNPNGSEQERNQRDALAARGYWQAFQAVKKSVQHVLSGNSAGSIADKEHRNWYREMFAPSITAGILTPLDLAGYRNSQVYIRHSMHVPPRCEAVRDVMPVLFELLRDETEPSVRVVLGHFMFVYIHPYMDGNGRMGRFLMNVMLAAGGFPWVVIPVEERDRYMAALEAASVSQDIGPFTDLLVRLIDSTIKGASTKVPGNISKPL